MVDGENQALNKSKESHDEYVKEIFPATYGICFFGTPHRGADCAELASTLLKTTKMIYKHPNVELLRALETGSETLEHIEAGFKNIQESLVKSNLPKIRLATSKKAAILTDEK